MAIIDSDIDFEHLESLLKQEEITLEPFDLSQQSIEEESSDIFKIFEKFPKLTIENAEEVLTGICNYLYKEENFWVDKNKNKNTEGVFGEKFIDVIIKYPKVIVTDGKTSHIMKDFYVNYCFAYGHKKDNIVSIYLSNIKGRRGVISPRELNADYQFSHLSGGAGIGWKTFCFGSSTPISTMVSNLSTGPAETQKIFKLFLLFDVYIEWQSNAGIPYREIARIHRLGKKKNHTFELYYPPDYDIIEISSTNKEVFDMFISDPAYLKEFIDTCIDINSEDISIDFIKFSYLVKKIILNSDIEDFYKSITWIKLDPTDYSLYRYSVSSNHVKDIRNFENSDNTFIFKDDIIKCKVEEFVEEFQVDNIEEEDVDLSLEYYFPEPRFVLSVYYAILTFFVTILFRKNVKY